MLQAILNAIVCMFLALWAIACAERGGEHLIKDTKGARGQPLTPVFRAMSLLIIVIALLVARYL